MPRFTAVLIVGLLLASLVALSCGGGAKNEVAATPTAKSVATAGKTPASKRATSTPIPTKKAVSVGTPEATVEDFGDEPTRRGDDTVCLSRAIEDMVNLIGGGAGQ